MGQLSYAGESQIVEIDDATLAHLRLVTVTKLRRGESFPLTLRTSRSGTETLWMHASIPVRFAVAEEIELQRPLLVKMMAAASSAHGLDLTDMELAPLLSPAPAMHAVA
ncbi:hypothetical protein ABTZ44_14105 [Microbacterium oxydans]|jgi:hypothetical protein|uniref:DUF7882 domain-containing protein n=1 Tax=Microbacterium oxydans TaxID=82380 RepID=A0A147DX27_9MICO|nr:MULTISPECIES: hypothetical protein [Microbacterium]AZS39027.1 hypothetical protein CVS54_00327 [Microbacterium oxydans]KAB1890004.1 hypothetical protein F6W69_18480 [Microbacterium oxydans]KKX99201.1 hypothetical protein AAY78_03360 [Microbacterium sp. Ag1]KTR75201.1 hypothetical protein NS234_16240 [Microbacterium oxydans]MBE7955719.1 hypothetical protein [Microbacterium sp. R1]